MACRAYALLVQSDHPKFGIDYEFELNFRTLEVKICKTNTVETKNDVFA
ncbi:hypothetical protein SDC9_11167 [bioreactor metagenome]|uniref:Uncharacterized protein n=1 Tax=bioreactor metagenome TaxID=1076179 RepID=A0A644TF23_9ZZZZ